jgi:hypothetical protein
MADDTDRPTVDEILYRTLRELNHVRHVLLKADSSLRLARRPTGSLDEALHTDDPLSL